MLMTRPIAERQLPRRRPPRCTARPGVLWLAPLLTGAYLVAHVVWWLLP